MSLFEQAADAVVNGDLDALRSLLRADPTLVDERSARAHAATLLHYVSANGVEEERQRTPANIVEVATLLLDAGAAPDALSSDGWTPLTWVVSSVHPARAGKQVALTELLLDRGAGGDGPMGSPLLTAVLFGYREAAEALARKGARIDDVVIAAALNRVELLDSSRAPPERKELALISAATHGRVEAVEALLARGVDIRAQDNQGFTALHWASFNRHLAVVDALLARQAPLEVRNSYGGTVLDSVAWAASNKGGDYTAIVQRLLGAGADARQVDPFPTGIAELDALIAARR